MAAAGIPRLGGTSKRREQDLPLFAQVPDPGGKLTLETVTLALEQGGDVNAVNQVGDTALHFAASNSLEAVVKLLAERGAKLDVTNLRGETPLMRSGSARLYGPGAGSDESMAELLRSLGARK